MANQNPEGQSGEPFNEREEKHKNELIKEKHRRNIEWIAVGIIVAAFLVSGIGIFAVCGGRIHTPAGFRRSSQQSLGRLSPTH